MRLVHARPVQSAVMRAARITSAQRTRSARIKRPNASPSMCAGSAPSSRSRTASSGAARLFWIASASLPRIGAGVPVGRTHDVVTWPLTVVPPFNNPAVVKASGDHFPYAVPGDVTVTLRPAPLRTGFWRAVYAGQFGYAEECFLDDIARRGGAHAVFLQLRQLAFQFVHPLAELLQKACCLFLT